MRFLSAKMVFPISSVPLANGIVVVKEDGSIENVLKPNDPNGPPPEKIEVFDGALCPGFINSHCHLELSHMKDVVPENTGLPDFLTSISTKRNLNEEKKAECMLIADRKMWEAGIQAVGDICNTNDSLETKTKSNILYHSFVEVFGVAPSKAPEAIKQAVSVANDFRKQRLPVTIVPHAPYSVSPQLHTLIRDQQAMFSGTVCIHNQETESEDKMFVSGTGKLMQAFRNFGIGFSHFEANGKNALRNVLPQLAGEKLLLVHNTFTTTEDMNWANSVAKDIYWCSCPWANEYIENRIPNIPTWLQNNSKVCVGTDSLASNHQLSVLEELKLIQQYYPEIELGTLLKMATINGAEALQFDKKTGSFDVSKLPGVVFLKNVDINKMRLTNTTSVQRIV